ncbi:MAG: hypothetical protein IV085_11875 [Thiobacillus sp.]|nr:hypothetical protein [Thiobacillus sp.]
MNIRVPIALFALLALVQSVFLLPAAADTSATVPSAAVSQSASPALEACPPAAKGAQIAQIATTECCKGQKGICGCRAGKIVCCDSKPSTHPACTCHGDNGFIE